MKIKKIGLDMAYYSLQTSEFFEYLQEICEVFNLEIVGIIPVGPAGAWPEVTFRGEESSLIKFLNAFFDSDFEGEGYLLEYGKDDFYCEFGGPFVDERYSSKGKRKFINEKDMVFW